MVMALNGKLIWSVLRLIRAKNLLIVALTQYLIYWSLILPYGIPIALSPLQFSLLVLSTVLVAAGGYVINDYMDVKTDEINHGDVIVGTVIKRRAATVWHAGLTFTGVVLGLYLSYLLNIWYLYLIHPFAAVALWYYSMTLKREFLMGNLLVSGMTALAVLIVPLFLILPALSGPFLQNQRTLFLIVCGYALFAFLANLIREIIKDLEDVPGDSAQGFKTIAIQIGPTGTKILLGSLIAAMLVLVGIVSYKLLADSTGPLLYTIILVVVPSVLLLYQVLTAESPKDYGRASTLTKVIMLFGIVSMWAFNLLSRI